MSARLARGAFASVRAAARSRPNLALPARRNMSAQSHGAQPKKSDLPWIIGSAIAFGPLFLYLLSPSANKSSHAHVAHIDQHHEGPAAKKEKDEHGSKAPEVMKDDEGTPADVTDSVARSEESDAPKESQSKEAETESPKTVASTRVAAENTPEEVIQEKKESTGADAPEPKAEQPEAQNPSDETPSEQTNTSDKSAETPAQEKA